MPTTLDDLRRVNPVCAHVGGTVDHLVPPVGMSARLWNSLIGGLRFHPVARPDGFAVGRGSKALGHLVRSDVGGVVRWEPWRHDDRLAGIQRFACAWADPMHAVAFLAVPSHLTELGMWPRVKGKPQGGRLGGWVATPPDWAERLLDELVGDGGER